MSTCRGAAPPHLDCPHGKACDWDGRRLVRSIGAGVKGAHVQRVSSFDSPRVEQARRDTPKPSRQERRAAARARRT